MSNTDTEHVTFIVVNLAACSLWTHKATIVKVEHIAIYVASIIAGIITAIAVLRLVKRLRHWRQGHNSGLAAVDAMTGLEFERYVAKLLKTHGFSKVRLTEEYDYGIDIIATKNDITWGIQVKRYSEGSNLKCPNLFKGLDLL